MTLIFIFVRMHKRNTEKHVFFTRFSSIKPMNATRPVKKDFYKFNLCDNIPSFLKTEFFAIVFFRQP